jgi:hypothetical protein
MQSSQGLTANCKTFPNITKPKTMLNKIILAVLVFELRTLYLLGRHTTTWTRPPSNAQKILKD